MKSTRPKLIAVVGPTASGKTDLAIALARKFNGEVISADSRQIYHGMDIGTGKPVPMQSAKIKVQNYSSKLISSKSGVYVAGGVAHHLIDIRNPDELYTAAEYKEDALKAVAEVLKRGKLPILAGGTGLYVRAVIDNLDIPNVPPNPKLREKLERELAEKGVGHLFSKLVALDPEAEYIIDGENPRRVIRALEIALVHPTSPPRVGGARGGISAMRMRGPRLFDVLELGISLPQRELHRRIDARINGMFRRGLVAEVERLIKTYGEDCSAFDAIGYREVIEWHRAYGKWPIANTGIKETKKLIKKNTRAYAKRQITWFKKDVDVHWVRNQTEAAQAVKNFKRPLNNVAS